MTPIDNMIESKKGFSDKFKSPLYLLHNSRTLHFLFRKKAIITFILLTIQELQILSLLTTKKINGKLNLVELGNKSIRYLSKYINPAVIIIDADISPSYLRILKIVIFATLIILLVCVWWNNIKATWTTKSSSSIKEARFSILLDVVVIALVEFLSIPVCFVLSSGIAYKYGEDNRLENSYSSGYSSWFGAGSSLYEVGFEVLGYACFFLFCSLVKSVNFARRVKRFRFGLKFDNSTGTLGFFIVNLKIVFFHFFGNFPEIYLVIASILGTVDLLGKKMRDPYIDDSTRKVETSTNVLGIWVHIAMISRIAILKIFNIDSFVPWLGLVFLSMAMLFKSSSKQNDLDKCHRSEEIFENENEAIKTLDYFLLLFQSKYGLEIKDKNEFLFEGLLRPSIEEERRMLVQEESSYEDKEANEHKLDRKAFLNLMIKRYLIAIASFNENFSLKISFLYFLSDFTGQRNGIIYQTRLMTKEIEEHTRGFFEKVKISWATELEFRNVKRTCEIKGKNGSNAALGLNEGSVAKEIQTLNKEKFLKDAMFRTDVNSIKAIELLFRTLEDASFHLNVYWNYLTNHRPRIDKLYELIKKAIKEVKKTEKVWKRNYDIYKLSLKAKKNYGYFLKNILMQEEEGDQLIKGANSQLLKKIKERFHVGHMYYKEDLGIVSMPVCILTQNPSGKMIIYNCNNSFGKIVGYRRIDVLKGKFKNYLMNSSVEFYRNLFKLLESDSVDVESYKNMVINFKTRYKTFVTYACNIGFYKEGPGELYITLFLTNFSKKNVLEGSVMVDSDGELVAHNSGCSTLFNLPSFYLKDSGIYNITDIVNDFEADHMDSMGKQGSQKTFYQKDIKVEQKFYFKGNQLSQSVKKNRREGQFDLEQIEERTSNLSSEDSEVKELKVKFSKLLRQVTTGSRMSKGSPGKRKESVNRAVIKIKRSVSDIQSNISSISKLEGDSSMISFIDVTCLKFRVFKCDDCDYHICSFWRKIDGKLIKKSLEQLATDLKMLKEDENKFFNFPNEDKFMFTFEKDLKFHYKSYKSIEDCEYSQSVECVKMLNSIIFKSVSFCSKLKIDYSKGIKTYRLFEGYMRDIKDLECEENYDDSEEDFQGNQAFAVRKNKLKKKSILNGRRKPVETNARQETTQETKPNLTFKPLHQVDSNAQFLTVKYQKRALIQIKKALNKEYTPKPIRMLTWASTIYIIISFLIEIYLIFYQIGLFKDLMLFSRIEFANGVRASNLQEVHARVRDIALMNQGFDMFLNYPKRITKEAYSEEAYSNLILSAKKIFIYSDEIVQSAIQIDEKKEEFLRLLHEPTIKVLNSANEFEFSSLDQVINQIESKILRIESLVGKRKELGDSNPYQDVTFDLPEVKYILFNTMNNIKIKIKELQEFSKAKEEQIFLNDHPVVYEFFRIWNIIFHPAVFLLLACLVFNFQRKKEKIAEVFLGFSSEFAKKKAKKCLKFQEFLQRAQEKSIESMVNDSILDAHSEGQLDFGQSDSVSIATINKILKKKNSERELQRKTGMFSERKQGSIVVTLEYLKVMFFIVITIIMVSTLIFLERDHTQIVQDSNIVNSVTVVTQSLSNMRYFYNSLLHKIYHVGKADKVVGQELDLDIVIEEYSAEILVNLSDAFESLSTTAVEDANYERVYKEIFVEDACKAYEKYKIDGEEGLEVVEVDLQCEIILDGLLKKGFYLTLSEHVDQIMQLKDAYYLYKEQKEMRWEGEDTCPQYLVDKNYERNLLCLLTSKNTIKITLIQERYLRAFFYEIGRFAEELAIEKMESSLEERKSFLIIFIIIHLSALLYFNLSINQYKEEILNMNALMAYHDFEDYSLNSRMEKYVNNRIHDIES